MVSSNVGTCLSNSFCLVLFCNLKLKLDTNRSYYCFQLGQRNDHLFEKELFIRFSLRIFCERLSICMYAFFPFGFEDGI